MQPQAEQTAKPRRRIEAIDAARGIALLAMASYHLTWDLEFFGYVDPGLTAFGGWKLYARCIASTFLFLVGVSLFLAHGDGIRWAGFWKRFAMVAGAAALITTVTFFAVPDGFIFFGILHQIALASLLGLAFLRLPALLTLAAAVAVIAAPNFLRSELFDNPAWWWLGLSSSNPHSNDYVPLFPWFGAVLAGIAAARFASGSGLFARLARIEIAPVARPLALAGRHSLAFYLIHQPVLFGCVWLFSQIFPAPAQSPHAGFLRSCQNQCEGTRDSEFCSRYCACMLDTLDSEKLLEPLLAGKQDAELRSRIEDTAGICTASTDNGLLDGEDQ